MKRLKKFWRPWADPQQLMQLPHRHRVGQTVFYTLLRPYQMDGVRGHLALCLNERQQRDARESRRDEILYAQKLLAQGKSIKPGIGTVLRCARQPARRQVGRGRRVRWLLLRLLRPAPCPETKMLSLYFDKDVVEKAFRSLKGITQLRPIRHWLAERVHAHVFLCYLAYLLLSLLQYRLRQTDFTAESALLARLS